MRYRGYVYKDADRKWRWRIRARNNRNVACSGESFSSRTNARRALVNFAAALGAKAVSVE
jgi:uncharacterized protein YegP (UPF0339 family)